MSDDRPRASRDVEDLSALSRRGALSASDERAFVAALAASATLATAHRLGLDFDQVAVVRPGDESLIAEMATRVVSRRSPARLARLRLRLSLIAATLALAGSATAFWRLLGTTARKSAPVGKPGVSVQAPGARAPRGARSVVVAEQPSPVPVQIPVRSSSGVATPRVAGPHAEEPSARTFQTAESLFREANAARRSGDAAVARALYLRLEHDFPASEEAHVAHVSLGKLLLAMGRASEAEQQFASYLGGHPALAQEALVGRAQSLAVLGRAGEERRVWRVLLHDYPSSIYVGRAQQRLMELGRSAAPSE